MTLFVLGNAAADRFYDLPHLPRPGETLLARHETHDLGGKGLNQAIMAARAGAAVSFWSVVGDDGAGERIRALLAAENIDGTHVLVRPGNTDQSIIFVAPSGENTIVSTATMARSVDSAHADQMLQSIGPGDLLLLQGNLTRDVTRHSMAAAAERGARTMINPAPIDFDYAGILPAAEIVVVNEVENETLSGTPDVTAGAAALVAHGVKTVVTTRGSDGAILTTSDGTQSFFPPAADAVDTTGAGDVFCGVFAAALARGMPPADACAWSVRAAAIAVTRRGTLRAFPDAAAVAACRDV